MTQTVADTLPDVTDLTGLSDGQLLDTWRGLETRRRQCDADEVLVIAQVQARRLAFTHGCTNDIDLARHLLRIPAGEAKARIAAAEAFGPRQSLTGQPLTPLYPVCAAAVADGAVLSRVRPAVPGAVRTP